MSNSLPKIIVILGPTASGKTKLAVKLAKDFNGEIVSADSRQVYKGMDIGSGKDLNEYKDVEYHLIDIASPKKIFNLSQYQKQAHQAIKQIINNKKLPILCGGTGLYAEAVFDNYLLPKIKPDNELRNKLLKLKLPALQKLAIRLNRDWNNSDWNNPARLIRALETNSQATAGKKTKYDSLIFAIDITTNDLKQNIVNRLNKRLKQGMIDEVAKLHKQGLTWQRLESFGLEYKIISHYLQNKIDYNKMCSEIINESIKLAKRQITWLNRPAIKNRIIWIKTYGQLKKLSKQFI